ncbi:MAG: glycosyltransferase family 2 protein [Bacteroidetes bacterium]|nr:glycosyltransferase family 2 protein [Bacteroidota bacterium]
MDIKPENNIYFSIITVNRNNAIGLKKTIESVISQTNKNFEYIVIDGASKDDSNNIIKSYEGKISFWISEEDTGIYNAMNKGIKKAIGKYCIFLNSGDYFLNNNVLELFENNMQDDLELYFGNIQLEKKKKEYIFSTQLSIFNFIDSSIAHGASAIKRQLFTTYGFYNEQNKIVSDWEFFIKAILINKIKYKNIPNIVTIYQDGGISVNKEFDKLRLAERETVFANLLPEYNGLINEYKKLRAFHLFWRNTICYKVYVKLLSIKNIFKKLS